MLNISEVTAPAVFVGPLLPYTVLAVNVKSLAGVVPPIRSPATLNVSLPAYPVPHFIIVAVALPPPDWTVTATVTPEPEPLTFVVVNPFASCPKVVVDPKLGIVPEAYVVVFTPVLSISPLSPTTPSLSVSERLVTALTLYLNIPVAPPWSIVNSLCDVGGVAKL